MKTGRGSDSLKKKPVSVDDLILEIFEFVESAEETSTNIVESALGKLAEKSAGSNSVRLALIKEKARQHLKKVGFGNTQRLVDAPFLTEIKTAQETKQEEKERTTPFLMEVTPFQEPVDGGQLLTEIKDLIGRYFVLPKGVKTLLALWVMATWVYRLFFIFPYLKICSPVPGCGKSSLLLTIGYLSYKPILADNTTSSSLFRTVEKYGGTLLLDELDAAGLKYDHDKRGLLNSGYSAAGRVLRSVKTKDGDFDVQPFATYGPKALCGIGNFLPATVRDRSIPFLMKRKTKQEKVDRWKGREFQQECRPLAQKLSRWVNDNEENVKNAPEPMMPEELGDRAMDIWEPLFIIAGVVGGNWLEEVEKAALLLMIGDTDDEELSIGVQLLLDLKKVFDGYDRLASTVVVGALKKMEDRPWSDYRNDKSITTRQLSKLLKLFEIGPKPLWIDGKTVQGYQLDWFSDAFSRYVSHQPPPPNTQGTQEPSADKSFSTVPMPKEEDSTWGSENGPNPHEQGILGCLGDRNGGSGEIEEIDEEESPSPSEREAHGQENEL